MSSLLERLRAAKMDPDARPPKRVTVLDSTDSAPEFVAMVKFMPQAEYNRIMQPYRRKNANPIESLMIGLLPKKDQEKAKGRVLRHCLADWSGLTGENVIRLSEAGFLNAKIVDEEMKKPDQEIPFEDEFIDDLGALMNNEYFFTIQNVALAQEEWLQDDEGPEKKAKKGGTSTSSSSPHE